MIVGAKSKNQVSSRSRQRNTEAVRRDLLPLLGVLTLARDRPPNSYSCGSRGAEMEGGNGEYPQGINEPKVWPTTVHAVSISPRLLRCHVDRNFSRDFRQSWVSARCLYSINVGRNSLQPSTHESDCHHMCFCAGMLPPCRNTSPTHPQSSSWVCKQN